MDSGMQVGLVGLAGDGLRAVEHANHGTGGGGACAWQEREKGACGCWAAGSWMMEWGHVRVSLAEAKIGG